jgi:hypothetical protein
MDSRLRIIVSGMVGLYPVGGMAWHYLQYLVGLARLGHDVYYHEDTWSWPYHPLNRTYTSEGTYSGEYVGRFFDRYAPALKDRWHYLHLHETSFGMKRASFDEVARTADLFLNVSGACMLPADLSPDCVKVFLDTDPGYNQIMLSERFEWSEFVDRWCESVAAHDRHFTYAENIHGHDCSIPAMGYAWKTTRMPMVMDLWEQVAWSPPPEGAPWTTVMTWNPFKGKVVYRGVEYRSKGSEFDKLIDLPRRVGVGLKVAVGGVNAPLDRLAAEGWQVLDGPMATVTAAQYQDFIAGSRGELSPAKHVYVALKSGWFSERSACYLACGRPVVVQDTGFAVAVPAGEGIVAFSTVHEAAAAIEEIEGNYDRHARAARSIAGDYFGSGAVLGRLIEDALSSDPPSLIDRRKRF